jgi:prophage tail gpP-like protein
MMQHAVELSIEDAGRSAVIDVWDRYDISLDMFKPGSPWTFTLWRSDNPDNTTFTIDPAKWFTAWQVINNQDGVVKLGANVRFRIDGATVLNGQIEEIRWDTSKDHGASVTISGRDLAGPSLDWHADPRIVLKGRSLQNVLQELFNTVGADVIIGAGADAAREVSSRVSPGAHRRYDPDNDEHVAKHRRRKRKLTKGVDITHARPGETVWQVADSICKRMGFMMWVAPTSDWPNEMAIVVDTPNYEQDEDYIFARKPLPGTDVTDPRCNILSSTFTLQVRDIPTFVNSGGHHSRGDSDPKRIRTLTENEFIKQNIHVSKGLIQHPFWLANKRARSIDAANQYAARHISEANRHFGVYQCTVQGHGQFSDGTNLKLYALNSLARVVDRVGGTEIVNETLLIDRITFSGNRQTGQTTTLHLHLRDAVQLTPDEGP